MPGLLMTYPEGSKSNTYAKPVGYPISAYDYRHRHPVQPYSKPPETRNLSARTLPQYNLPAPLR